MFRAAYVLLGSFLAIALAFEIVSLIWRAVRALARDLNPWRRPRNRGERRAMARRKARR